MHHCVDAFLARGRALSASFCAVCTKPVETQRSWSPAHAPSSSPASFLSGRLAICLQTTSLIGLGKCFDFKNVCNTWKTMLRFGGGGGRKRDAIQMLLSRSRLPAQEAMSSCRVCCAQAICRHAGSSASPRLHTERTEALAVTL